MPTAAPTVNLLIFAKLNAFINILPLDYVSITHRHCFRISCIS